MFELDEKVTVDFVAEYEQAPADSARSGILALPLRWLESRASDQEPDNETSRVLRVARFEGCLVRFWQPIRGGFGPVLQSKKCARLREYYGDSRMAKKRCRVIH